MNFMSAGDGPAFLDTNILIYAVDGSAGVKHGAALELVRRLQEKKQICISVQVMSEFHVNVTQKLSQPLTLEQALDLLKDFSHWKVYAPSAKDVFAAGEIQRLHRFSFWDAMIIQSALECGCGKLYSEDLAHGQVIEGLMVINPFVEPIQPPHY
jgi:predicted nucleic acid-binding protein